MKSWGVLAKNFTYSCKLGIQRVATGICSLFMCWFTGVMRIAGALCVLVWGYEFRGVYAGWISVLRVVRNL